MTTQFYFWMKIGSGIIIIVIKVMPLLHLFCFCPGVLMGESRAS